MTPNSERDLRWNFFAGVMDAAGWGLGMGLVSATTFLPLFVRQLSGSTLDVGLISAGMILGWYLPGIFVARYVERLPRVKRYVMVLATIERLILLMVVPLIYLLGPHRRGALLVGFLICWFLMNLAMGCNSPSYFKLIAKTIPAARRGRLYGIGGALAGLLGIGAGQIAGQLIARLGYPHGYALCFTAAAAVLLVSYLPLGFMREPETVRGNEGARERENEPAKSPSRSLAPSFPRSLAPSPWCVLRQDPGLRFLTLSHILGSAALAATGFYADYAIRQFHAGPHTVGNFTSTVMAAQVIASLLCGTLADRRGNKWVLQIATASGMAATALAVIAPSLAFFYPIMALGQLAITGWGVASFNLVLELGGEGRAATYTAITTLLTGPFKGGMPLLGAYGILLFGYGPVFAVAAVITGLALVALARGVVEPRTAFGGARSSQLAARSEDGAVPTPSCELRAASCEPRAKRAEGGLA